MKEIYFILFISVCSNFLQAQQLPLFTQYREMQGIINPAAINRDFIRLKLKGDFGASYRKQWIEDPQAPTTLMVHAEYLQSIANSHLISGLYAIDDKLGKESTTGIYGRLGVLISDRPKDYGFSAGLNGGMVKYRIKFSELTARDIEQGLSIDQQKWHPDIGAGIFGYTKLGNNSLVYAGLSIPQVFGFKSISFNDNQNIATYRHYYLTGGYILPLNNESTSLEFSTWTKFVPNTTPNVDLNLRFNFKDLIQIGAGYNTNNSLSLEASYTLVSDDAYDFVGLWRIGYSYNVNFSSTSNYLGNSHEIHLSIAFGGD